MESIAPFICSPRLTLSSILHAQSLQLCLMLCDPMDCSPPGSSVHGDSPSKNTGMGCHTLLLGILTIQGSNPDLPHCRQILSLPSEPPEKTQNTGVGSLFLLQGIFLTQESNQGLLHCRWILYQLSYQGRPVYKSDFKKQFTSREIPSKFIRYSWYCTKND